MKTASSNILVSGGNGLIGSRIIELLSPKYNFYSFGRTEGFDITKPETFSQLSNKNAKYFLHLAAKTDVDGCESEKELGENSQAWKINVKGTETVANYCRENKIKLIHISTDFVFDGEKKEGEFYTENDLPNPINYYAKTKYEAEKIVQSSGTEHVILRLAYPYRKEFDKKKDFVRAIVDRLKQGLEVNAVTDHIMCPTFIDDIAIVIDELIKNNRIGIYHCVGSSPISPYDAVNLIAQEFDLDKSLIRKSTRAQYFEGKAQRPFNLYLKNDKIENLGIKMKSFNEGLGELKKL